MILLTVVSAVAVVGGSLLGEPGALYRSWWFRALMGWLGLALGICGLRTLADLILRLRHRGIEGSRPPGATLVSGVEGLTAEKAARRMHAFGYRVGRWNDGSDRIVEGVKGLFGWLGRSFLHCGLAAILLGGLADGLLGWRRSITVAPGDGLPVGPANKDAATLVVDSLSWEPGGGQLRLRPRRGVAARDKGVLSLAPGGRARYAGAWVRLASLGPSTTAFSSARLHARHDDGRERIVNVVPDRAQRLTDDVSVTAMTYLADFRPGSAGGAAAGGGVLPPSPAVHVLVSTPDSAAALWVTPWEGTRQCFEPWCFILGAVVPEPRAVIVLQVTPGDPLFAVGLALFALGSVLSVACPVRRVWALIPAAGPATLGAHAPLAGRAWREEADRLSTDLVRSDTEHVGLESYTPRSETT